MSKKFGIDLGTTNSALSVYIGDNKSQIVRLDSSKTTMPSCVMWLGDDNWVVGEEAYAHREEPNVSYSIKSHMGTDYHHTFYYNGKIAIRTPQEISAMILKELIKRASYLYPDIKDVTITVPAAFNTQQRQATREAGEMAGLNVVAMINEPTSAALGYNADHSTQVLVYDLGGGTHDVSILGLTKESDKATEDGLNFSLLGVSLDAPPTNAETTFEVIVSEGDTHLGGDDLDKEIMRLVVQRFNLSKKADDSKDTFESLATDIDKELILLSIESAKKSFTTGEIVQANINFSGGTLTMTADDVYKATHKIYTKSKLSMNRALGSRLVDRNKISTILLVGGSTKNRFLQQMLREDYPEYTVSDALNPDESVAIGASIQTAIATGEASTTLVDVSPYTVSVGTIQVSADGKEIDGRVTPLVRKNTPLPVRVSQTFSIENRGSELPVDLFIGDGLLEEECQKLKTVVLKRTQETQSAELILIVDANGILTIKVQSGGEIEEVTIGNILGANVAAPKTAPHQRMALRWRKQLQQKNVEFTPELTKAFRLYEETGNADAKAVIQKALASLNETSLFKK